MEELSTEVSFFPSLLPPSSFFFSLLYLHHLYYFRPPSSQSFFLLRLPYFLPLIIQALLNIHGRSVSYFTAKCCMEVCYVLECLIEPSYPLTMLFCFPEMESHVCCLLHLSLLQGDACTQPHNETNTDCVSHHWN